MIKLVSMDEVFAMAVQIEDNAGRFYRRAAELYSGNPESGVFARLAVMEDGHRQKFDRMRHAAPERNDDPAELQAEGAMYLEAIASGYRLEGSPTATAALTGQEGVTEVLRNAVELEKLAILFYHGLKKVVSDAATLQTIDQIIAEENEHLVAVMAELKKSEEKQG